LLVGFKTRDKLDSTSVANALLGTKYITKGAELLKLIEFVLSENKLCKIAISAIVVFPEPVGVQSAKDSAVASFSIPEI